MSKIKNIDVRAKLIVGLSISCFLIVFCLVDFQSIYLRNSQVDDVTIKYHKNDNNYFKTIDDFNIKEKSSFKDIYFTALNNHWSKVSFKCDKQYKKCINDFQKSIKDTDMMTALNDYVHPFRQYKTITYRIKKNTVQINIIYLYTDKEVDEMHKKIKELNLQDLEEINLYVNQNISYKLGSNSLMSLIKNRQGNCKAIADFVNVCLYDLGRYSYTISNNLHAWNVILENGERLHTDATWNIRGKNYYFKLTTSELAGLHEPEHQIPDIYDLF